MSNLTDLGRLKVKDLIDQLRQRGAPLSGRKADLVERYFHVTFISLVK